MNLTNDSFHFSELFPTWSPDSDQLLYSARTDEASYEVFVMNGDGSNVTNLTDGPEGDDAPVLAAVAPHSTVTVTRRSRPCRPT